MWNLLHDRGIHYPSVPVLAPTSHVRLLQHWCGEHFVLSLKPLLHKWYSLRYWLSCNFP